MKATTQKAKPYTARQLFFALAWVLVLAKLMMLSQGAWAQTISGTVVSVSDGDTVTLLTPEKRQIRIRVQGIDAPERSQAFGNVSRQAMASMVFQKQVFAMCSSTDRYGRMICVLNVQGQDAGLSLVTQGLAWHYKQYEREQTAQNRALYAQAEQYARSRKSGLWADPNAQAPWGYRRAK